MLFTVCISVLSLFLASIYMYYSLIRVNSPSILKTPLSFSVNIIANLVNSQMNVSHILLFRDYSLYSPIASALILFQRSILQVSKYHPYFPYLLPYSLLLFAVPGLLTTRCPIHPPSSLSTSPSPPPSRLLARFPLNGLPLAPRDSAGDGPLRSGRWRRRP